MGRRAGVGMASLEKPTPSPLPGPHTLLSKAFWSLNAALPRKGSSLLGHFMGNDQDKKDVGVIPTFFRNSGFFLDYCWALCFILSPNSNPPDIVQIDTPSDCQLS